MKAKYDFVSAIIHCTYTPETTDNVLEFILLLVRPHGLSYGYLQALKDVKMLPFLHP